MSLLFKNYSLVEVIICRLHSTWLGPSCETQKNMDKNDTNEQNTHTTHREKDNSGKG